MFMYKFLNIDIFTEIVQNQAVRKKWYKISSLYFFVKNKQYTQNKHIYIYVFKISKNQMPTRLKQTNLKANV